MQWKNDTLRWGTISQLFHWGLVLLVATQFYVIYHFNNLAKVDPNKLPTLLLHKSIGMTILAIVLLRLIWRLANKVPLLPHDLHPTLKLIAKLNHFLLYACLFIMPITGYLMTGFSGREVHIFGYYVPMLVDANRQYTGICWQIHKNTAIVFYVLICMHFFAALFHHFIRKDNTPRRMLPLKLK